MSSAWGHAVGVFIVLMMTAFIGLWVWAWLPRHKRMFGRLARLPMADAGASPGDSIPPAEEEERR